MLRWFVGVQFVGLPIYDGCRGFIEFEVRVILSIRVIHLEIDISGKLVHVLLEAVQLSVKLIILLLICDLHSATLDDDLLEVLSSPFVLKVCDLVGVQVAISGQLVLRYGSGVQLRALFINFKTILCRVIMYTFMDALRA